MQKKVIYLLIITLLAVFNVPGIAASRDYDGLEVYILGGYKSFMGADDTLNIMFDSSGGITIGAGLKYTLPFGMFLMADYTNQAFSGYRVYIADPETFIRLDIGESLHINAFSGTLGIMIMRNKNIMPYLGLGVSYNMVSTDSDQITELGADENGIGYHGVVGADFKIEGGFILSLELRYEVIPDLIGNVGVPAVLEEDDLGGISALFKIGYVF